MSKKTQSRCPVCNKRGGVPKKIPYGAERRQFWCDNCDYVLVSKVDKKRARRKGKKDIKDQLDGN